MKHLGDITKIDWSAVDPVDCVTGGSPCQDLSLAGKRAGLAGERSGLYMEQIKCVKELRKADEKHGKSNELIRPRYMVWENVVGAFSSNKGKDFAAVLEEAVKVVEPNCPPVPVPGGGWPYCGTLVGAGWSIAWRTHDAQYWGVAQRRRRISVVCDFGGASAPEILFERKSLPGDSAQSRETREAAAQDSGLGIKDAGTYALRMRSGCAGGGKGALVQDDLPGTLGTGNDQTIFAFNFGKLVQGIDGYNAALCGDVTSSLGVNCGMSTGRNGVLVLNDQGGEVMDVSRNVVATLRAQSHGHEPIVFDARGNGNGAVCPTITGDHEGRITDYTALCIGNGQTNQSIDTVAGALNCMHDQQAVLCIDCRNDTVNDISATIQAKSNGGYSLNYINPVAVIPAEDLCHMVRRLTPLECERLQGFPDGWTDIGEWVDSKGKKHKPTDAPRYKALGNSIALPFWHELLKRISAQYDYTPSLGSLFDGIGGFPLCWERINGKGTALWASEIEDFPIEVTKRHFPEPDPKEEP